MAQRPEFEASNVERASQSWSGKRGWVRLRSLHYVAAAEQPVNSD
jgi:hypothetical protein